MPTFEYKARDKSGQLVTGTMEASEKQMVSFRLQESGYMPVSIGVASKVQSSSGGSFLRRVKIKDINVFTRQLYTMQRSGLPLMTGLRAVAEQCENSRMRQAIQKVIEDVEAGMSLSQALALHPNIFDDLYVNMVKAGESSGRLEEVLERVAILNEKNADTQGQIKSALRYPLLTLGAMAVAFMVIITFVIPKFASLFAQMKTDLPIFTRILIGTNRVVTTYWYLVLGAIAAVVVSARMFVRTAQGRYMADAVLLKVPIVGSLLTEVYMSRFARNFATLFQSGLPILSTLDLVGKTVNNAVLQKTIEQIKVGVNEGKGMHDPMKRSKVFTPMVLQMVHMGEETGKIDELLNQVADYYDRETELKVKNLTALIEPIFLAFMGAMVLVLALGVFLPMWSMMQMFN